VIPSHTEGVSVVELEPVPRGAAPTLLVDVAAAVAVALAHGTPDGGRNVARRRRRVGASELLAGSAGLGVAPGFEPFELLGDGTLDDRGEVAAGISERIRAVSRSSLSRSPALAVNCTL
jgi:hypothetical protein